MTTHADQQTDTFSVVRALSKRSRFGRRFTGFTFPRVGGFTLFGVALLGLPFNAYHLAQVEALNRELGKLCTQPPPQAHTVCRLHARLVSSL